MSLRLLACLLVVGPLGGFLTGAAIESVTADTGTAWPPAHQAEAGAQPGVGTDGADRVEGTDRVDGAAVTATGVLTADGDDRYVVATSEDSTIVSAPPSNAGGNLRLALWRDAVAASADHESCATFRAVDHRQQPGIALRIRSGGGRTRAITVTKNIWADAHWVFNVHVMDSGAAEPLRLIGTADLAATFLLPGGRVHPYPWRMCARVDAGIVRFVAWPAGGPRPDWSDRSHGGAAVLPAGWGEPGRPGLYVGHLPPGTAVEYGQPRAG